ncbi:MAG: putative porin, partial [Bacteroidota bacterium]
MWTLSTPGEGGRVGAYPWADLLAGIQVRQTLIFLRWEHANLGWPASVGQWVPGYTLGDRRLRLGIDWKFWD